MPNEFSNMAESLDSPSRFPTAVTPSDSTDLSRDARSLYVGTGGNVAVVRIDSTVVTFLSVPSGFILPVMARRVNATGTTASNIVAL